MSPEDLSSCANLCPNGYTKSAFGLCNYVDRVYKVRTYGPMLCDLVPPDELQSDRLNEVILRGDTQPSGVFASAELYYGDNDTHEFVNAVSLVYRVPIFVYNKSSNTVTVLNNKAR